MTTEEIEKAAEDYANEFFSRKDKGAYQLSGEQVYNIIKLTFISSAEFANKYWQEKTRWIPVKERLPEVKASEYPIYAKNEREKNDYAILVIDDQLSLEYLKKAFTHWKEIE